MNPNGFLWRTVALGLIAALVIALGGGAFLGFQLYDKAVALGDANTKNAELRGELSAQSAKVEALSKESDAAKARYALAMKNATAATASNAELSKQLSAMTTGPKCSDAMPVVDRVLEATK